MLRRTYIYFLEQDEFYFPHFAALTTNGFTASPGSWDPLSQSQHIAIIRYTNTTGNVLHAFKGFIFLIFQDFIIYLILMRNFF